MTRVDTAGARILLVHADAERGDALRHALVEAGYDVVMADSGRLASAMLERECPDVVVSAARLADMDGFEVLTLVRRDATTAATPFLLLAGGDRPVALAAAEGGASLVLTGDVSTDAVLRRVTGLVTEADGPQAAAVRRVVPASPARAMPPLWEALDAAATRPPATPPAAGFQGSLGVMDLAEVTQAIALGGKTGCLEVALAAGAGTVVFDAGRLVHASVGDLTGETAFGRLLRASQRERHAHFRFSPSDRAELSGAPRTIARSLDQLLLSIAAGIDEDGTDSQGREAPINDTGE
jgi:CheY-like chemotaxis protein